MTSPDPFITTADLSDYLGRDVTADDGATIAIDSACDMVRTLTEQDFNQTNGTVYLDGTGTDALLLPQLPVGTVSSVTISGTITSGTFTGGSAISSWALRDDGVLLRTRGAASSSAMTWPVGRQNVQVAYTSGYGTADVPRDIRMVALQIAARIVIQGVASGEGIGGVSISYASPTLDLTPGEMRIMRKYRR